MEGTTSRLDDVYDALADRRRRTLLALLAEADRPLTVHDLSKRIAEREHEAPITELPAERLERIHVSLHHRHVPKLADAGFVEFDPDRSIVEPTDRLDSVARHLPRTGAKPDAQLRPDDRPLL